MDKSFFSPHPFSSSLHHLIFPLASYSSPSLATSFSLRCMCSRYLFKFYLVSPCYFFASLCLSSLMLVFLLPCSLPFFLSLSLLVPCVCFIYFLLVISFIHAMLFWYLLVLVLSLPHSFFSPSELRIHLLYFIFLPFFVFFSHLFI